MRLFSLTVALTTGLSSAATLIPKTVFDSTSSLTQYFSYNYPWGTDHNGGARMAPSHAVISTAGTLTLTAQKVSGQPPATHGGKQIPINYLSGAVFAKEPFTVPSGGGFIFSGSFQATTTKGTWPAFWLTAVNGWPPEIDMAEWKGSGKISFNTFNTSSVLQWKDVNYADPGSFHNIKCQVRDRGNGKDAQVKYFLNDVEVTTHYGKDYVGKPLYLIINLQMEGDSISSGSPGPSSNTTYSVRNLEVTTM
ncbi:uncharacterized protein N0V89_000876 [Didymosphaeria variabile]|uniref:GH16 domain-containing protein n=1 Tax=Didymosphaeria variabile TaxID=1932322 RepID=A0A9W8XXE4_9PLEO|nr:uncharacterized protein N0V89_000876 [Didymosphaeria variabile]KAJ4360315.1 hypothetical protein N0V89_000876 [Didymosphaeria variabile]